MRIVIIPISHPAASAIISMLEDDAVPLLIFLEETKLFQKPELLALLRKEAEFLPLKIVIFPEVGENRITEGLVRWQNAKRPWNPRRVTKDRRPFRQY